jgi:hypothetical protein
VVDTYADLWKAKHEFPPLDVFYDGTTYVLGDGFIGCRRQGREEVERAMPHSQGRCARCDPICLRRQSRQRPASLAADKRLAVTTLLDDDEWSAENADMDRRAMQRQPSDSSMTICAERRPALRPPKSPGCKLHPLLTGGCEACGLGLDCRIIWRH